MLYNLIVRTAVLKTKCPDVCRFLGKRLTSRSGQKVRNCFQTLMECTRIKHALGSTSIEIYDNQTCVLRIETTTSEISPFSCHHKVESQTSGAFDPTHAPICETINTLEALFEAMAACSVHYLRSSSQ